MFKYPTNLKVHNAVFFKAQNYFPNKYDLIALIFIVGFLAMITLGVKNVGQPLASVSIPAELNISLLPQYALYTTLRMFAAMLASLIFTFIFATLAAKNKKAEIIIIPTLDILQSVPILGFLTFTVTFFMNLFPGKQAGAELAAVFAIFTSQAWNMAFSFYQSLQNVPQNLQEVCRQFGLNAWQKFWRLEVPFATPGLVWNIMLSMSGSWFFVVASEAIAVGNTQILLPGIGSWLSMAIKKMDVTAIVWAIVAMGVVIVLYDQLIFRPIVAWADKFNMGQTSNQQQPKSWIYDIIKRARILKQISKPLQYLGNILLHISWPKVLLQQGLPANKTSNKVADYLWMGLVYTLVCLTSIFIINYLYTSISWQTLVEVLNYGIITLLRVVILVLLASLLWVPLGIWVGLRPNLVSWVQPLAQFLAAFPANILFPIFVIFIVKYQLNVDIWISPLMILGTQWYIFFNVIAGVSVFPNDLKEAVSIYHLRSWTWWRKIILPAILPYYVTGAITASGGSWNASIVAEVVSWGNTKLEAHGLGAFIADATTAGNYHQVVLGVSVMAIFVIILNRLFWQKLYMYAEKLYSK
jgi:NitT/TauT family transport system permease protein